jgi:hypothetical protein
MAACWLQYLEPSVAWRLQRLPESVVASHCGRTGFDAFFETFTGAALVAGERSASVAFVAAKIVEFSKIRAIAAANFISHLL